ncbi:hypothetical protein SRHO_G00047980 [Serrasalmus rhombeus]
MQLAAGVPACLRWPGVKLRATQESGTGAQPEDAVLLQQGEMRSVCFYFFCAVCKAADADEDECHRLEPLAGPYLLISPARVRVQGTAALRWETAWRHSALTMPPGCVIKTLPTAESGYRSWKEV